VGGQSASEAFADLRERGCVVDARQLLERLPVDGTLRSDALEALKRILARATPKELLRFESEGRSEYGWWFHWHGVDPRAVARAPIALRELATFHPSGYVREEATRSLAGEEEALPYILLRLNDWVEPVATAAQHAVEACLARASGEAVVRCLPIVERLRSVRRRALQAVVDSVERSVISPSARPALREALASAPPAVRRTCVPYAARLPPGEAAALLVPLTTDRDPVVASRATQTLARALPGPALRGKFAPLLHSRIGRVRLLALGALLASGSDDLDGVLRRALLDPAAAVRELARYELGRRGSTDLLAPYATALRSGDPADLVPALCGLRECGTKVDAPLALQFVSHRRARVRVAAVRALGKLDPEQHAAALADALADPSARVIRTASEALRGHAHLVDISRLRSLLNGANLRAATAALGLLCEGGYWAGLELALDAARRKEPAMHAAAVAHVERLVAQQAYTRPPNLQGLELAFDAAAERLPFDLRRRLSRSLAAARRMS
jgi:HEAT repeat protein